MRITRRPERVIFLSLPRIPVYLLPGKASKINCCQSRISPCVNVPLTIRLCLNDNQEMDKAFGAGVQLLLPAVLLLVARCAIQVFLAIKAVHRVVCTRRLLYVLLARRRRSSIAIQKCSQLPALEDFLLCVLSKILSSSRLDLKRFDLPVSCRRSRRRQSSIDPGQPLKAP